jgi:hypothetical protein
VDQRIDQCIVGMEGVSRQFVSAVRSDAFVLNTILKAFEGAGTRFIKISYEFYGSVTTIGAFAV